MAYELAWAAGLFDGEGNIRHQVSGRNSALRLSIGQKDREVLDRFQAAVGGVGNIYEKDRNGGPYFDLCVQNYEHVQAVIAMIWPWLSRIKRDQAVVAFTAYYAMPIERLHKRRYLECSQHGCRRPQKAMGLCATHYRSDLRRRSVA